MSVASSPRADADVWRIADKVAWTESEDRVVVLAMGEQALQPIALQGSALVVWGLLVRHAPIGEDDLVFMTAAEFDVSPDHIRTDVRTLLSELRSRLALHCSEATASEGRCTDE